MILPIPIWHAGGAKDLFLRLRLRLREPCRAGEIRCWASGPYHIYIDGVRLAGGTGGLLLGAPMPERLRFSGAWDSGEIEILVVARAGEAVSPWFCCEGKLFDASAVGGDGVVFCTGVDWHARPRRQDPSGSSDGLVFERQMAIDAPVAGESWEGVTPSTATTSVDGEAADGEAVGAAEFPVAPNELLGVGSVPAQADLEPTTLNPLANCKCVHHDALLAGGHGATQIRTVSGQAVQLQYDLGRQVWGWPALRLRGGRNGVVDLVYSTRRDTVEHHVRFHCGDGRQEMAGLALVRARYLTVRLTGFDEEDLSLEAVTVIERRTVVEAGSRIRVEPQIDAAWQLGAASLDGVRQEAYGPATRPQRYNWLEGWILQSNDLAQTGSARVARQTLLRCAPGSDPVPSDYGYLLALHDYHQHTGDADAADQALDQAQTLISHTAQLLDMSSASSSSDWAPAATAALALAGISAAAVVAEARDRDLEESAAVQRCSELLESCWREEAGLYAEAPDEDTFRQWTNGLALLAIGDEAGRGERVEQAMRRSGVAPVGDLTQVWVLAAGLGRAGRRQRLLDLIGNHWLRRLARPGSTWRDKRAVDATGAAPGPDALWTQYLLGVRPIGAGWSTREIRPPLELLARGHALIPVSEEDHIEMSWVPDRDDEDTGETESTTPDAIRLTLQIDVEGETHLRLARDGRKRPTISVNDEVVWRNEKIYPNPIVHLIAAEEDHVLLLLERTGRFRIRVE
ncbi:MAG: hypothetical protein HN712_21625 [Gemmatimonadetes bacterium]|nr:hypothetical protein [Gemmatimonadota bacterium]MBT6147519.1 hypothetical protein [Gemmatimonadota bacterium]MBT7862929.1 hypothetical protein [Gemmatimonadota bacterium]